MNDTERQQCVDDIAKALGTDVELRMDRGKDYYSPDFAPQSNNGIGFLSYLILVLVLFALFLVWGVVILYA